MAFTKKIANWGNYPSVEARLDEFQNPNQVFDKLQSPGSLIARGTGLSYGDASLASNILSTLRYNRVVSFDHVNGIIDVEAGIMIDEVLRVIVPKGWFVPVTPGTKFVTIGGAVAGDVHGKNHHTESSFCHYVIRLDVMLADGSIITCGPGEDAELFRNICGGLGLGALILRVQFRLKPIQTSYIRQQNKMVRNLDEMLDGLQEFGTTTYSVSWIDCLSKGNSMGRGVLMLGEHATPDQVEDENKLKVHSKPKFNVPFFFPPGILNSFTVGVFNTAVYNKYKLTSKDSIVHYDTFFYPLDFVRNWNKAYSKRGFLQYQFVIPYDTARAGLREILKAISESGRAAFLAVLKEMGKGENVLSFPLPGFTLALDFPVAPGIFPFLDELDKKIVDLGGRIYLVKDARMTAETYWKGYPNAAVFKEQLNRLDPEHKFASTLSQRLQMK
jgi:decaprenylphospho-beta-D-ribofuranose 2-oxidase